MARSVLHPPEGRDAGRGETTHPTRRASVRKVLVPALAASAAVAPAVAFAATDDNQTQNKVAPATSIPTHEQKTDAKHKLHSAVQKARHERRRALRAKARKRAAARKSVASPQLQAIAACE